MALEVTCTAAGEGTRVHVTQTGFEESARWRRYYEVVGHGWERALASLKSLLENNNRPPRGRVIRFRPAYTA